MSIQPKHRCTLEEYFDLEIKSEAKYEYRNGEVYELSGVSPAHGLIEVNLPFHLKSQLRGRSCRGFPRTCASKCQPRRPIAILT